MSQEQAEYSVEKARKDNAILKKYAAIQKASEDKIGCQKIYVDMTSDLKAAMVLDEIIFFTLPRANTGKSALRVRKNGYLWMAVRRTEWWERKRLTERESDAAIDKLEKLNLIVKSVHRFNSLPTVHLRLNVDKFFQMYFEALENDNPPEDESDTNLSDINDLYEMMGIPFSPNGNLPNGEGKSPNGDDLLPNGDFINSPDISLTQPPLDDFSSKPDIVDGYLQFAHAPGIKREARINDILSYLGETFRRNTETKEWLAFAKYIDSEFQTKGWDVKQFVSWLFGQKDYNPNYWPVKKMMEFYPSAFTATETKHSMFETLT